MKNLHQNTTQTNTLIDQPTNPQIFIQNTLSNAPNQFTFSTNQSQSHQIFLKKQPQILYSSKPINRKTKIFNLNEDQKILRLVLLIGPKFKKIAKQIPGKSINNIKNRYYRNLRYRWDEILGNQYTHLNQQQEKPTLVSLVTNSQLHQEFTNILIPMFSKIQKVIDKCLL
ncbi:unnamed protein product [Paramecium sonneborni]|uniref:HTH myb-type domain-containing protein n=1 Tax=Paramecium sonneborni TaxID=65129 RepID=A0A8S1RCZ8_9CILI|nr:unnamed protein product [Paramecium sonneborni]